MKDEPMDASAILPRLQDVFFDVFGIDGTTITRDTSAKDVKGWDSVAHILLITAVEKKFSIRFKSREIAGLNNVGELIDVIATK